MNTKDKINAYVVGIVMMLVANLASDGGGDRLGWALYGAIMAILVTGLVRTIRSIPEPSKAVRHTRAHWSSMYDVELD